MKKAIVTLAIGDRYRDIFNQTCRANWQAYCTRFNYDLIVVTDPLDTSERAQKRSPAWQKLLILSQPWSAQYDRIVWLDTDILINNAQAPDISVDTPLEKVGAVEHYSNLTPELNALAFKRLCKHWKLDPKAAETGARYLADAEAYHLLNGVPGHGLKYVVQTGVLTASPAHHRQLFEHVYNTYDDTGTGHSNYEMPALSYELQKHNLVHWVCPRFNYIVIKFLGAFYADLLETPKRSLADRLLPRSLRNTKREKFRDRRRQAVANIMDLSFFAHFASTPWLMRDIK